MCIGGETIPDIREKDSSIKEKNKAPKHRGQHRAVKAAGRQLTAKGREALAQRPRGEDGPVEYAADSTEQLVTGAVDEVKGAVRQGAGKVKNARKKRQAIKTRKQEAERAAGPDDSQAAGPEARPRQRADASARADGRPAETGGVEQTQPRPPTPQERMRQVAVQDRREQAKRPVTHRPAPGDSAPPAQAPGGASYPKTKDALSASFHPSIHPSGPSAREGGGPPVIREKVRGGAAPKQKPAGGAAAKAPVSPIKTTTPPARAAVHGLSRRMAGRAASTKAAEQMKRHGQRQMVQRAKQAAKAAASLTRKIAAAVTRAVAALIGAVTAFAGGAVLLVALCVVILVAAVVSSPFGIFFSDEEKAPGAIAPYAAISQINTEYFDRLESLKAGNYDSVDVQGQPPNWREVLAVFACKTAGTDDGVDVATFDADRVERLRMVFWDMTAITSYVETIHHSGDGEDNPGWTERILHITITPKTAEDMAAEYGFSEDMRSALAELLNEDNGPFWAKILYGSASDTEIVAVAFSQLGNEGGGPYWSWYGFSSREEWCACFVSWCANECGYIEAGIIPKFAVCITGSNWFKERGQWAENTAEPSPGAIIFFDWDDENGQDGEADHVGIVERVEDGRVYTIEGNSGDQVCQNSYPVGYYEIYGYGLPAYG